MTEKEKLKTRMIIAQSVGVPPDNVRSVAGPEGSVDTLYVLDDFKGCHLVLAYDRIPTKEEAREGVKELYLCASEWDFDNEMKSI